MIIIAILEGFLVSLGFLVATVALHSLLQLYLGDLKKCSQVYNSLDQTHFWESGGYLEGTSDSFDISYKPGEYLCIYLKNRGGVIILYTFFLNIAQTYWYYRYKRWIRNNLVLVDISLSKPPHCSPLRAPRKLIWTTTHDVLLKIALSLSTSKSSTKFFNHILDEKTKQTSSKGRLQDKQ